MCRRLVRLFSCFLALSLLLASAAQAADPSLIGWWPLDETEGDIAFDASGNGNDGILSADVSWVPDGGRWNGAALFEGPDTAHIEISAADMSASAGTIMMWGNLTDPQPAQTRYFFGHTTQPSYANRIQLYIDGTTELDLGLGDSHGRRTDMTSLQLSTWYHVALTWDNGAYVVYLDGEVLANGSYAGLTDIHDIAWIGNDGNPDSQGTEGFGGMLDEVRLHNRALTQEEIQAAMRASLGFGLASEPSPANEATDVLRDAALSWTTGEFAVAHDVYFGTTFDDVNAADRTDATGILVSQGQSDTSYTPASLLEFGQTYYWRIDEVNAAPDNTIFKGNVWSFTTEPLGYPIENIVATASGADAGSSAENTINGSGLDENDGHSIANTDMWLTTGTADAPAWIQYEFDRAYQMHELLVWNYNVQFELMLGFGFKDVTIEYSVDGTEWMVFGDVQFAQATATAGYQANTTVALDGIMAKYIRLTATSGHGMLGQFGLSEVRFLYVPAQARFPEPADGATDLSPSTTFSWRAGREAEVHEIYLSTDQQAVLDGTALVDTVAAAEYAPADLQFGSTYYWKVNEVNDAAATPSWEGDLWSFAVQEFMLIDGFEAYDDDENRIYDTWLDGWVNDTGSTVGYFEAPFAEQTIVNSGTQSMPLQYNNADAPFYSETELAVSASNWTANGADTLRIFVQGQAPAFAQTADGSVAMSAIGADIWNAADEFRFAYKSLTGDGSIIARVDALDATPSTWAKAGVMIRQGTEAGAINTFMAMTGGDGGGATFQQRVDADTATVSQHTYEGNPFAPPYWVRLERAGNTFSAFISPDGETWQVAGDVVDVPMADPVLIGLAVTSHNASVTTGVTFSNVSTTGNVTGQWTTADIGVAQPTGGNSLEDVYVAIEDAAGNVAVVTNPGATALPGWQEWLIPLSDFAGVNLSNVQTMVLGVGDRNAPSAGGTGLVFIDDIGVGHPASE